MRIRKAARGGVTGRFGDTNVPGSHVKRHSGTDIGHGNKGADDLRVVAPNAGRVIFAGDKGDTYGLHIIIDHGNGYTSLLAHLAAILVTVGADLVDGQTVGVMGKSGGDWPVHLHQELRLHGRPVDPEKHFGNTTTTTKRKDKHMDVIFARGHLAPETYRIDTKAMTRRYVDPNNIGILAAYEANGGVVVVMQQPMFDAITKEAGSR